MEKRWEKTSSHDDDDDDDDDDSACLMIAHDDAWLMMMILFDFWTETKWLGGKEWIRPSVEPYARWMGRTSLHE